MKLIDVLGCDPSDATDDADFSCALAIVGPFFDGMVEVFRGTMLVTGRLAVFVVVGTGRLSIAEKEAISKNNKHLCY